MPLLKPTTMNDILSTHNELSQQLGLKYETTKITIKSNDNDNDIDDKNNNNNNNNNQSIFSTIPERIPAFGLLMAILSVFCFSIASVIVRILISMPSIEILVWRSLCQFIVYFTTTILYDYNFFGHRGHRLDLFYRSLSGTISLSAIYIAYRLIPLSDASTIHFASPVFVTVFAYFLLKEPLTKLQICTGTITLTGVMIIAKPEFIFGSESDIIHERRLEGIILSIIASMTAAFSMITLRKLKTTPVAVVVMWYSFTLIICGSIYLTITQKWIIPMTMDVWLLLIAIGLCGILDQYCITLAFQYEKAGPISVVRTLNIVLSFLWEVLLLNENIEWTSILGACLICSCVIVLALVKWYKESPETFNKIRRKLCCFCPMPGGPNKSSKKSKSKSKFSKKLSKKSINKNDLDSSLEATTTTSTTTTAEAATTLKSTTTPSSTTIKLPSSTKTKLKTNKKKNGSNESIDSITVQNTVNSNAILLIKSDDDSDSDSDSD